jgi:hypothetical protein
MKTKFVDICILGLGPAGLGAALKLSRTSFAKSTLCFEAGVAAEKKYCSILERKGCRFVKPCQMITGIGGSSVLAGGKISLYPAGRSMSSVLGSNQQTQESLDRAFLLFHRYVPLTSPTIDSNVIQECSNLFAQRGFEFRYYDAYIYNQADLISGYQRMLHEIVEAGISVHLETEVTAIEQIEGGFLLVTNKGRGREETLTRKIIMATGRSGRELLSSISPAFQLQGVSNSYDIGVRLEFPSSIWPEMDKYHNDLKLHFMNARTFCVCKDGFIAPYRLGDMFLLEGHSDPNVSTGLTNLAITVRHSPNNENILSDILSEVRQRLLKQSHGKPVRQRLIDFLEGVPSSQGDRSEPSSISYWQWGDIRECLPGSAYFNVRKAVDFFASRLLPTNTHSAVSVYAPEIDYYWDRYPLGQGFLSKKEGLYIVGDSTGHFRGILQAFCSGLECVGHILSMNHAY